MVVLVNLWASVDAQPGLGLAVATSCARCASSGVLFRLVIAKTELASLRQNPGLTRETHMDEPKGQGARRARAGGRAQARARGPAKKFGVLEKNFAWAGARGGFFYTRGRKKSGVQGSEGLWKIF